MADDRDARIAQLEAELRQARAENASLREQQAAAAEVLRALAESPTDLQGVLDTLAASVARLSGADRVVVHRLHDGALWPSAEAGMANAIGFHPTLGQREYSIPISRTSPTGRAIVDRMAIVSEDVAALSPDEFPDSAGVQRLSGTRSALASPLG